MISKEIFNKKSICIDKDLNSKNDVLKYLADWFSKNNYGNDVTKIYQGFIEREEEGSTALPDGIGIPHSKTSAISRPGIFVLRNKVAIEWDSLDDKPTYFFIALAIPNDNSNVSHLKMLSSIARKLIDDNFKQNILAARSVDELYDLLSEVEII